MVTKKQSSRKREPVDPNETREQRFQRLALKRVNRAVKAIAMVGNLSNKSTYNYTLGQVDKIAGALETAVVKACGRFRNAPDDKATFSF